MALQPLDTDPFAIAPPPQGKMVPLDYNPVEVAPAQGGKLIPLDYDPFASEKTPTRAANVNEPPAQTEALPAERPGFLSTIAQAGLRGGIESGTAVAQAPTALRDRPQQAADNSYVGQLLRTPISQGWSDPKWWAANIAHGAMASAPALAGGAAGTLLGEAVAPEGGGLVGAPAGFAIGSMIQSIAPAYQAARANGLDHDAAVRQAIAQTGVAGAFGAVMGAIPGVSAFGRNAQGALERPISEALLQIFGTVPAVGTAQELASGAVAGRMPTADELATGYASNVGLGLGLAGAHAAIRGAAPEARTEAPPAETPITTPRTPEQALADATAAKPAAPGPEQALKEEEAPALPPANPAEPAVSQVGPSAPSSTPIEPETPAPSEAPPTEPKPLAPPTSPAFDIHNDVEPIDLARFQDATKTMAGDATLPQRAQATQVINDFRTRYGQEAVRQAMFESGHGEPPIEPPGGKPPAPPTGGEPPEEPPPEKLTGALGAAQELSETLPTLREGLAGRNLLGAAEATGRIVDGQNMIARAMFPLTQGTKIAQDVAFRYANMMRNADQMFVRYDRSIQEQFPVERQKEMALAASRQSEFEEFLRSELAALPAEERAPYEQQAREQFNSYGIGVDSLPPAEREFVVGQDKIDEANWARYVDGGVYAPGSERIPFYIPRVAVKVNDKGVAQRLMPADKASDLAGTGARDQGGVTAMQQVGQNLRTNGAMFRKLPTRDEWLAAMAKLFPGDVRPVDSIRLTAWRWNMNERALAGRQLVEAIKQYGEEAQAPWISDQPGSGYFTLDHPAMRKWTPVLAQGEDGKWSQAISADGQPQFKQVPIHISKDFKGPLTAVLTAQTPDWYRALMVAKGASMRVIMASPLIHLNVELGRALPIMRGAMFSTSLWRDASAMMDGKDAASRAFMSNAMMRGLATLREGWRADPAAIQNEMMGVSESRMPAVLQKVGKIYDHMLWDNVRRLQVAIYIRTRQKFMDAGLPQGAAETYAAHIANRYAGALPAENLHQYANMAANLVLFSRSFTLGNLGVLKDMFNGAPSHVRASVEREFGPGVAAKGQALAQRAARAAVGLDIGINWIANAMAQTAFRVGGTAAALGLAGAVGEAYDDWRKKSLAALQEVGAGNPLAAMKVLPQYNNEEGRRNRALMGADARGQNSYLRLAMGKLGEEFLGWTTGPAQTILAKLSPWTRPLAEDLWGRDTLNRAIYRPHPETPGNYLANIGRAVWHVMSQQVPSGVGPGSYELGENIADVARGYPAANPWGPAAAKIALSLTGVGSISKGAPGGPEVAANRGVVEQHQFDIAGPRGDAIKLLRQGRDDDADKTMRAAGMTPAEMKDTRKAAAQATPGAYWRKRAARIEGSAPP